MVVPFCPKNIRIVGVLICLSKPSDITGQGGVIAAVLLLLPFVICKKIKLHLLRVQGYPAGAGKRQGSDPRRRSSTAVLTV